MARSAAARARSRILIPLASLPAVLLLASPGAAQRKQAPEVNGWNAPRIQISEEIPSAEARGRVRAHVDALLGVLRAAPTLSAPAFPIYSSVQASFADPPAPQPIDIRIIFYRPGMVGTAADDQVRFQVNDPSALWDTERGQSVHTFGERELYLEPRFDRAAHGYPVNARDYIVVARAGRALFRPVSLQQYYALVIADLKAKGRDDTSGIYAEMVRKLEGRYARLAPAQRAAPAYGCMDGFDPDTYLCEPSNPEARRLVEFNPGYWDRTLPRTAFQLLVLYRFNPDKQDGPVGEALTAAWERLDWSSWRRLLEAPAGAPPGH